MVWKRNIERISGVSHCSCISVEMDLKSVTNVKIQQQYLTNSSFKSPNMASLAAAADDGRLGEGGDAEPGRDPQDAGRSQLGLRHPRLGLDVIVPVAKLGI